jgi:putative sigma-54 modulation protein
MDIAIRGRHVEVSEALRVTVEEKVTRLSRFVDGMERAEVRFSQERNPRIADREVCEVTVHGHGHIVRARATAVDTFAALDRVVDKLEHQMIKLKGKLLGRAQPRRQLVGPLVDIRRPYGDAEYDHSHFDGGDAHDGDHGDDGPDARIVKTKQFSIRPMTPEEAALQLDLLGHGFYFFTNSETERAAVVYRRRDGHIGLIDAT